MKSKATEEEQCWMDKLDNQLVEAKNIDKGYGVEFGPDGTRAIEPSED